MASNATMATLPQAPSLQRSAMTKYWILAVVSLTTFMVFVDATVVNTALPSIAKDFGASNSALQWIVNSYSLVVAGLLLLGGTVGDRFGRKKAMIGGVLLFGAASLGAAVSPDSTSLIVMRGFQGLGAAFMLPATLSIISNVFDREERARAIAVWAMVGAVAAVAGPALGGYLVDQFSWQAVFLLHLPIAGIILAGLKIVPESKDSRKRPLDVTGALLATGGLLAVVFGIVQGGEIGWNSAEILSAFIGGGLLLTLFGISQARNPYPMLPLRYLAQRDVTGPFLVMMVLVLAMAGVFFLLTQYFQLVQGRSALTAGLYIMPVAGTMMAGAGISTKFSKSAGPKILSIAGGLVVMAGMAVLTLIEVDSNYVIPAIGLALFGLGMGMVMPTVTDTIMAAVPADDAGLGSALNDTSREFGFALGVAVLGSVFTAVFRNNVTGSLEDVVPAGVAESVGDSLGSLGVIASELSPEVAASVVAAANQAFVDAMGISLVAAIGFVGLSIAIAVLALPRRARQIQAEYAPA